MMLTRTMWIIPLFLMLLPKQTTAQGNSQKLDIIFVLDGSYSVKNNFGDVKRWTQRIAAKFDIENGINQIGVVQYSSFQRGVSLRDQKFIRTEIRLGQHTSNSTLQDAIAGIQRRGLATYTAHAINKTVMDFKFSSRWPDSGVTKVMVILTDGMSTDSSKLEVSAAYARSLGIVLFAVGVGNYNIEELRTIATGNQSSNARVLNVATFSGLDGIVNELSRLIVETVSKDDETNSERPTTTTTTTKTTTDPCEINECHANAKCVTDEDSREGYRCECDEERGYFGNASTSCLECPSDDRTATKLDIIFVLDGSYSMKDNFGDILRWTQSMAARFNIENGANQIGVVQFSSYTWGVSLRNQIYIRTEIRLGQHKTNASLQEGIARIRRRGTATYTSRAINKTVIDFQDSPRWSNNDVTKVMVVLTDGSSSDGRQLYDAAAYARSLGIIPYAVGVGNYNERELRVIATGNTSSELRVFAVARFGELETLVNTLSDRINEVSEDASCPLLPMLVYGSITNNGQNPGNTTFYSCSEGFVLSGPERRCCASDGAWTGFNPECVHKDKDTK